MVTLGPRSVAVVAARALQATHAVTLARVWLRGGRRGAPPPRTMIILKISMPAQLQLNTVQLQLQASGLVVGVEAVMVRYPAATWVARWRGVV